MENSFRKTCLIFILFCSVGCNTEIKKTSGAKPAEISKATNPSPLDQINFNSVISLQDVEFTITSEEKNDTVILTIFTTGLEEEEFKETILLEGEQVTSAEVEDLNSDGSPELFIFTQTIGSGSYGNVYAYSVNNKKSMSQIYFQPTVENSKINKGYMGHDQFSLVENSLGQRFPIYKKGDINANPTGGTRQVSYKLIEGEASRQLVVDKVFEYK